MVDLAIAVIRSDNDRDCTACKVMEPIAEAEGRTRNVIFVEVTLSSEFEKRINRVTDNNAIVKIVEPESKEHVHGS